MLGATNDHAKPHEKGTIMNIFSTIGATPGVAEATGSTLGKQSESPEAGIFATELETAETALVPGVETGRSEQEVDPNGLIAQLVALDLLATTTPQTATESLETAYSASPTLGVVAVEATSGPTLSPEQRAKLDLRVNDLRLLVDRTPESTRGVIKKESVSLERPTFDTSVQGMVRDLLLRTAEQLGIEVDPAASTGELAGQLLKGAEKAGVQPETLVKNLKNAFSIESAELKEPARAALAGLMAQLGLNLQMPTASPGFTAQSLELGPQPMSKGPGNVGYMGTGQGRPNDPAGRIHPGAQGGFITKGGRGFQTGRGQGTDPVTVTGDLRDWVRPIPVAVTASDIAQASKNIEQFAVSLAGKQSLAVTSSSTLKTESEVQAINLTTTTASETVPAATALSNGEPSGQEGRNSAGAHAREVDSENFSLNLAGSRVIEVGDQAKSPTTVSGSGLLTAESTILDIDESTEISTDTSSGDASAAELGFDDISGPTAISRSESKEIKEGIDRGIRESTEALMKMAEERRPGQVTVRMMPEDLGIIEVTLSQFGSRFDIDVNATDDRVRASMSAHRGDLVQNLETRGVSVGNFNVGDQTKGDMTNQQQRQQQENLMREDLQRAANLNSWETSAPISTPAPSYAVANRQAVDVTA